MRDYVRRDMEDTKRRGKDQDENPILFSTLKFSDMLLSVLCFIGATTLFALVIVLFPDMKTRDPMPGLSLPASACFLGGIVMVVLVQPISKRDKKYLSHAKGMKIFVETPTGIVASVGFALFLIGMLQWGVDLVNWATSSGAPKALMQSFFIVLACVFLFLTAGIFLEKRMSVVLSLFGSLSAALALMVAVLSILITYTSIL